MSHEDLTYRGFVQLIERSSNEPSEVASPELVNAMTLLVATMRGRLDLDTLEEDEPSGPRRIGGVVLDYNPNFDLYGDGGVTVDLYHPGVNLNISIREANAKNSPTGRQFALRIERNENPTDPLIRWEGLPSLPSDVNADSIGHLRHLPPDLVTTVNTIMTEAQLVKGV